MTVSLNMSVRYCCLPLPAISQNKQHQKMDFTHARNRTSNRRFNYLSVPPAFIVYVKVAMQKNILHLCLHHPAPVCMFRGGFFCRISMFIKKFSKDPDRFGFVKWICNKVIPRPWTTPPHWMIRNLQAFFQ